ncbi:MAG: TSUP family transporter [Gammaproteobacteria bacterium]|nr:TSUP family transporter [Gammaproteobacteria bacterium]
MMLLFATGLIAGLVDAIAGGGGLITLPVLLAAGLAPTEALATNKLQGSFGTLSSSLYFIRRDMVKLSEISFMIACTFVGSASGTLLVRYMNPGFLTQVIPILLILTALYFWFGPRLHETDSGESRISHRLFALTIGISVGFYDGFFGPGAGSFFAAGFVGLLGFNLIQATAHTKVLNLTSNVASLLFFAVAGHCVWSIGLIMAGGQLIGARLGARLVIRNGARIIRPLIVVVSLLISFKLLMDQ